MFTKAFWKDAAERAIATAVQTAAGAVGAGSVFDVNWKAQVSVIVTATALSLGKSIVAAYKTDAVSPASLVKE
jgi:ATP-dependent protease ClpP protease subunit